MKIIKGGITKPKGFKANALNCGIKKSGKYDLGLIYSNVPCVSAAVFTKNSVKAAPVLISQKHIQNNRLQAVIVNSGNANCFTGEFGKIYAQETVELFGQLLEIPTQDVLVASTGIIGKPLPIEKIKSSAQKLVDGLSIRGASDKFAESILTTDLVLKQKTVQVDLDGKTVTISGVAKGSGMIQPNMATMLGFVTTDVSISSELLEEALQLATQNSFNCITVDGCISTNDMVSVMASGLAENKKITKKNKDFEQFCEALEYVSLDLAKKIVLDGEGASKFIEISVHGARSEKWAKKFAMAIANSNLVKTANYDDNPNWGRVVAAIGSLGVEDVNEDHLKVEFKARKTKVDIHVFLDHGDFSAKAYTCDLTEGYIEINGKYN